MKVVVTGGAGFIGSHLVDRLIEEQHQVLVVDDLSSGQQSNISSDAQFTKLDIVSPSLSEVFDKFKPDLVYHLAAQKNVRSSLQDPIFDARVNVLGSLNVWQAARDSGARKFVFISTGGIYGDTDKLPTTEDHPGQALSPYILSKLTFESYLKILSTDVMPAIILRPANVYGPRQDPSGEAGVIAIFLEKALADEELRVNGDGQQTRDYLYVDDLVEALLKTIDVETGVYNISTEQATSLLELIDVLAELTGKKLAVNHNNAIVGEVKHSCLDNSLADRDLHWQPKYGLKNGLALTLEYFKTL